MTQYKEKAIRTAFRLAGYSRRKATKKPFHTQKQREDRLKWAYEHINWTEEDWRRMCWSDESSFIMDWGDVYVTRLPEEALHPDCMIPHFRGYSE